MVEYMFGGIYGIGELKIDIILVSVVAGENGWGVEGLCRAYVVWSNMCEVRLWWSTGAPVRQVRDSFEVLVQDVLIFYVARARQFV